MKNIFDYNDYKAYVNIWIQEQPRKGRGLLSEIARSLGIHTTLLSHTLRGDKDLTPEQAIQLADFISLPNLEADYFLLLVLRDRAGNTRLKEKYKKDLDKMKADAREVSSRVTIHQELNKEQQAQFYSSWIYTAIRQLTSIGQFTSPLELSRAFDIKKDEFNRVIHFLLETGLCKQQNGKIMIGPANTHVDSKSPFVFQHHKNWRIKALEKHNNLLPEELMYTAPFTISQKDFEFLREEVIQLIQKLIKTADKTKNEHLACLNIDLFFVK
jgi:uncharacterized protein (TIGR02147 family)